MCGKFLRIRSYALRKNSEFRPSSLFSVLRPEMRTCYVLMIFFNCLFYICFNPSKLRFANPSKLRIRNFSV